MQRSYQFTAPWPSARLAPGLMGLLATLALIVVVAV